MKINFNQPIIDPGTGKPVFNNSKPELSLRDIAIEALTSLTRDEQDLSGDAKAKRGELMEKIFNSNGSCDVTIEEVADLKKQIGKIYGPSVVYPAWKALENPVIDSQVN